MKVPQALIDEFGLDLAKISWKEYGRNDTERRKNYQAHLKRESEKRKRKAEQRRARQKPIAKTPKIEAPEPTTHDFPYLLSKDIPENGCQRATIIRPPEITETKWGNRYRIALEFEDHDKRRWSMNDTTFWNLSDGFGTNGSEWVGKVIELKVKQFRIEGKNVIGIIGVLVK